MERVCNSVGRLRLCESSYWQVDTRMIGTSVALTALYVVLECCPPAPLDQYPSNHASNVSNVLPVSGLSRCTDTVSVLVCTRPCVYVLGTDCKL